MQEVEIEDCKVAGYYMTSQMVVMSESVAVR